jgi:hypothetical protein
MVGAPLVLGALAALVAWGRARAVVVSPLTQFPERPGTVGTCYLEKR